MYISWWVYFVTGLSLVLQQPLTAVLAKTKADFVENSSFLCRIYFRQKNQTKNDVFNMRFCFRNFQCFEITNLCWTKVLYICFGFWLLSFNTWLISNWEKNNYSYKLSKKQNDFSLKMTTSTILSEIVVILCICSAWDKSSILWANGPKPTQI